MHPGGMTTYLQEIPGLTWLVSPIGLGAFFGLMILTFSGALGRVALFIDTLRGTGRRSPS